MANVLENVLSGKILLDDFKQWLIFDSVENCTEKASFISYVLNYVKDECAWLISKDEKGFEIPSIKFSRDIQESDLKEKTIYVSCKGTAKTSVTLTVENENREKYNIAGKHFHNNKQGKFQEGFKVKGQSQRKDFVPKELPKIAHSDHKSQFLSRKSLNANYTDETKTCALNENTFEEDIKSFDAFPPLGQKTNDTKTSDSKVYRRITPTPIQVLNKGSSSFGASKFPMPSEKVPNEIFKKTPFMETPSSNLQSEREMLKMTRHKLSQSSVVSNSLKEIRLDNVSPIKCAAVHYVVPDPKKVCKRNQLEVFSSIYDVLLTNALVPNVTSELYFLLELLTSKVSSEVKCDVKSNIFCSVHNCIFFCVTVLSRLQNMLNLLDKNTLISLYEIPFLSKFSPQLTNVLQVLYEEKQEITTKSLPVNRVPFLVEEDSRDNFIDAHSFASFRKQRDLFYELLRDWQKQPIDSVDVKFQENFSRKAKILISLGPNAVNMHHLAKLFQNQLIASCLGLEVNEVYDDLLSDIQKNFPSKFEKLRQRFLMPFSVGVPNPPPSFYGIQAFFCELIHATSSTIFNQQLQDIFISKILDFNNTDLYSDRELSSLSTVKEKYIFLLHTLRLLGKFLGYLYFLPYKVSEPVPASIVSHQLNYRKNSIPPLNVLKLLNTAVENNRVILTVPWIVEYLSMIDPVAKNLPYIENTLEILIAIYRGKYIFSSNSLNLWFLRVIIGWLFDVLSYPSKYCSLIQPITFENGLKGQGLDLLGIIDKQLVHSCCPYLVEFKVLICSYVNGIKHKNKTEIRKITPLSTPKQYMSISVTKQQAEIQLEDNFFFLHPPSLKKIVEFVSERMASKVINRIRSEVTEFKLHSIEYITSQEKYKILLNTKSNVNKLKSYVDSCILELYEKSQSKIRNFMYDMCEKDIEHIMPYLLADDVRPPVLKMCCKIAFRLAVDKVVDWCNSNLILVNIKRDIKNKLNHLSKGQRDIIIEKNICASSAIMSLRKLVIGIQSFPCNFTVNHLRILPEVLSLIDKEIGNKESSAKKVIASLSIDLYIALIIYYPEKCDEFNSSFVRIWQRCLKHYDLEYSYLGMQNIKFFLAAKNFEISCNNFILMFSFLINNGFFQLDKLKDYMTKLSSLQWKDLKCNKILCLISDTLESASISATN